ncbi:hypothetical protein [Antarcticirhabdus aurantiaca]|uniref:Uncharacterized protein n=1 Tax=Antarcticirhabdus aurantiaca TaxID=2606717 RepID=A0ACD4NLW9_9HYPH|nr:hypothetical protein [Antarcticirhabdus aurantiaca]WAJ27852.1 hypothetical protein OXU80_23905 [Jeongeuplla avenae]
MSEASDGHAEPELHTATSATAHTPPTSKRSRRLRFRVGYRSAPRGYLNLDTALDQLGWKLSGEAWEQALLIPHFPLQRETRNRRFCHYDFARKHPHRLISTPVIPRTLSRRRVLRRADRMYRRVRARLKHAIEADQVEVRLLTPDGQLLGLPERGALAVQMRRVFYTGTYRLRLKGARVNCRVLIDKDGFQAWINTDGRPPPSGDRQARSQSSTPEQRFIRLLPIIAAAATQGGFRVKSEALKELLRDVGRRVAIEGKLTKAGINRLWGREELQGIKQKPGCPSTENENKFTAAKPEIIEKLAQEYCRRYPLAKRLKPQEPDSRPSPDASTAVKSE